MQSGRNHLTLPGLVGEGFRQKVALELSRSLLLKKG